MDRKPEVIMTLLLEARDLSKVYPRAGGEIHVLRHCDLQLADDEAVAVVGASGSGKSTLLNILGGLDMPTSGAVLASGRDLHTGRKDLERWRARGVGYVFQFHYLLPDFTALENLLIPVRSQGRVDDSHVQRAREFLRLTGLADRADHLPGELSGGEQQRVAVARAFMNRPRIVLADEPFGNLDRTIGDRLGDLLFQLKAQESTSLVIVTHDPRLAARADRILHLRDGRLEPEPGADS